MPLKRTAQEREPHPSREPDEAEVRAQQPRLEPIEAEAMEPGRPHQDFVESKLRQYLRDNNVRSLVKPNREEIRAAAMPILCRALRNRPCRKLNPYLNMAHHAVADVVEHAREERWTWQSLSKPYTSTTHLDALVQFADDAAWLALEIPLPNHPPPKHPPIYYTTDPETSRPIPRTDSLIRGDYVCTPEGMRVTEDEYIHPWIDPFYIIPVKSDLINRGWDACYTLYFGGKNYPEILVHWIKQEYGFPTHAFMTLNSMRFSPYPPSLPNSCVIL